MCSLRATDMVGVDIHQGNSSSVGHGFPFQPLVFSDTDKSLMREVAANAMEELLKLAQTSEPLWKKSSKDGRDVLDIKSYNQMFPQANTPLKNPNVHAEASRDSRVVIINAHSLIDMFMDPVSSS